MGKFQVHFPVEYNKWYINKSDDITLALQAHCDVSLKETVSEAMAYYKIHGTLGEYTHLRLKEKE